MTELSNKILSDYQVRKTKAQKARFIEFMKGEFPQICVEQGGLGKNQNLILGDPRTAKIIVGAHYDTCARLPFPNFLTPKNFLVYILYNLLLLAPMIILIGLFGATENILYYVFALLYAIAMTCVMTMGKPNEHTANDNTSGIIALCEIWSALSDEDKAKCALVFFDNEENGLLGSAFYRKRHKKEIKDQLMINLDCISDGDHIMVIKNGAAVKRYGDVLDGSFESADGKSFLFEKAISTIYPSDQANFPVNVAIAAMKKNKVIGYYLDKIHTKHDVNLDEKNIELICDGVKRIVSKI